MTYLPTTEHPSEGIRGTAAESRPAELLYLPEKSPREWGIALLLFLSSVAYLRLFYDYSVVNCDEGIVLQGAERILRGEVLYRDFFSFYTPGSYYWIALLFRLFGSSLLVARTALLVYGGLFSVLTYLLARRVCPRGSALMAAYLLTLTALPYRFLVLHNWDSTLWAYLALYCAVRFLETLHGGWAAAVGVLTSLTFLFEHSKGAGLAVGLAVGFLVVALTDENKAFIRRRPLVACLTGFLVPFLLTFAYFASRHSLSQMLGGWLWPLRHYSQANTLPFGYLVLATPDPTALLAGSWSWYLLLAFVSSPCLIIPLLPILAVAIFVVRSIDLWRRKLIGKHDHYYVLICASLSGLLLSTVATRRDFSHLLYLAPLCSPVLAWVVGTEDRRLPLLNRSRPLLVAYLLASFTAFGMSLLWAPLNARQRLDTRRGTLKTSAPESVVEYLQANVPPGEKIFIYPYQPMYYYLTATFSPTRYEYLQPGMHTAAQFQEAISELASDRTRLVLFEPAFKEKIPLSWPSTPASVLAARDAGADYILANYRPCAIVSSAFWHLVAMWRRDLNCSGRPDSARQ